MINDYDKHDQAGNAKRDPSVGYGKDEELARQETVTLIFLIKHKQIQINCKYKYKYKYGKHEEVAHQEAATISLIIFIVIKYKTMQISVC